MRFKRFKTRQICAIALILVTIVLFAQCLDSQSGRNWQLWHPDDIHTQVDPVPEPPLPAQRFHVVDRVQVVKCASRGVKALVGIVARSGQSPVYRRAAVVTSFRLV